MRLEGEEVAKAKDRGTIYKKAVVTKNGGHSGFKAHGSHDPFFHASNLI